jgi:hypothetical protein
MLMFLTVGNWLRFDGGVAGQMASMYAIKFFLLTVSMHSHDDSCLFSFQKDTLIRYLLDELSQEEEGHADALCPKADPAVSMTLKRIAALDNSLESCNSEVPAEFCDAMLHLEASDSQRPSILAPIINANPQAVTQAQFFQPLTPGNNLFVLP